MDSDTDPPHALFRFLLGMARGLAEFGAFKVKGLPQRVAIWKNIGDTFSQKMSRRRTEKFLRRRTNHHGSRHPRGEKQNNFETSHYGNHIFAPRAVNFVHTPQLLANLPEFLS